MRVKKYTPSRNFTVGLDKQITIKHCADIKLGNDEQVTFKTASSTEYDVVRKSWGYYATPSINGRLLEYGLRGVLVKNKYGKIYLMLAEQGLENDFFHYLDTEKQEILCWLDGSDITELNCLCHGNEDKLHSTYKCPICSCAEIAGQFTYNEPPLGEVKFNLNPDLVYYRIFNCCQQCGHWYGQHNLDLSRLYAGDYAQSNYTDYDGIARTFSKITNLPPEQSDNKKRVGYVCRHAEVLFPDGFKDKCLIDIGSGTGVFPYLMMKNGWKVMAIEPDPMLAKHLSDCLKVETLQTDFFKYAGKQKYDVVTLNKVLEHVIDTTDMLNRVADILKPEGFAYIEVPDGEIASKEGPQREEFFIDHWHAFSCSSLTMLLKKTRLSLINFDRIKEPSGKYTIRAIAKIKANN